MKNEIFFNNCFLINLTRNFNFKALNRPYILALDIGTSSVRSAIYDFRGNVLPQTTVKNEWEFTSTDDGGAEIEAEEAFAQVVRVLEDVLKKSNTLKGEVEYVALCSFWHSLVGIDKTGKATTKVFGWAENRPAKYVADLGQKLNETEIHNRTGARFHSSYWPAKLLWLRKGFPDVFTKTDKWLSFSDFVALKLFGTSTTTISMASGTGIFDIRRCVWDEELLKFLKMKSESLPEIVNKDSDTFQLNEKYEKRWPKLKNAKWFSAIGDGAANNIGSGCVQKSKAALMIGTSGAMRVAYKGKPPKKIPGGLWCYRIDRKRVIIGGALSDGGGLYRWLKDNLRLAKNAEIEIAKRGPDSHGLTFLPFLAGERSTGYHEAASGAILGLKASTDTVDILQAALESVAFRFAEILDQLNEVVNIKEIIASGGALRESPVWTQIIADVLGRNLSLPDTHEASSRGAVLLALETIGKIENIDKVPTLKCRQLKADKSRRSLYAIARERHKVKYKLLIK